jgi:hypothetical protein
MELKAYQICEGWVTTEGNATFLTNTTKRNE